MLIFLTCISTTFAIYCNYDSCNPDTIGDHICSLSCMNEPCNFDSSETRFADKITIMKSSDCFNYCVWYYSECTLEMLGNDNCDDSKYYAGCNLQECGWDLGRCGYCSKNCFEDMLGDGVCNEECFTAECRYDLTDCGLCSKDCKLDFINDGICNPECYNPDCNYDGKDCGCAPNCKFDDYGKCKPACMVPDCNYDSMGVQCQYEDLREFYMYFQLLNYDFSITQNIDFLNCSSNPNENIGIYKSYCQTYESYKSGWLIQDFYCEPNCLKCTNLGCVKCDYSNGYINFLSECVLSCPTSYTTHPLIPSICYKNLDIYIPLYPKKIYVDSNTTTLIQNGSKEYPFKTLHSAIYSGNSPHIEILMKPGIHEIDTWINDEPLIISMTIRSDCIDCTEYAFLRITNLYFSFPTYLRKLTTFVNLIIDRESINYDYFFYINASVNDLICPSLYSYISLIEIASSASFYAVNTTFSNIKYNMFSVINAEGGTIKLYNTHFTNITTFNCPYEFSVIALWCNVFCSDTNFVYDSGSVTLNNGYFSNFLNFGSRFLSSMHFSNIKISNVNFSNIYVFGKWGIGSNIFIDCTSLFCITDYRLVDFFNNTFEKIYVQSSIIRVLSWGEQKFLGESRIEIFDNQLRYVWSSGQFLYVYQDARFYANIDNLNISESKFADSIVYLIGSDQSGANLNNIGIVNSSFRYIINFQGNEWIWISSIYTKDLLIIMSSNVFSAVINNYEKIYNLDIDINSVTIEGLISLVNGRAYISEFIFDGESLIRNPQENTYNTFIIAYLINLDYVSLRNIEIKNIVKQYNEIILEHCYAASFDGISIHNINFGLIVFHRTNYITITNTTISHASDNFLIYFYDCTSVHAVSSYLNLPSIEVRYYEENNDISFSFSNTIFIGAKISFEDYINQADYEIYNCSFFNTSYSSTYGLITTYFGTKNSRILTASCQFYYNKACLIALRGGSYHDWYSKFEWNDKILSQAYAGGPTSIYFNQSIFNNNLPDQTIFDVSSAVLIIDDCIFKQSGGFYIKSNFFMNNCTFENNIMYNGALLEIGGSEGYIRDCHFLNTNSSYTIQLSSLSLEISNTTFLSESIGNSWSIILILGNSNLSISNSNFISLIPQTAIYSKDENSIKIQKSSFKMAKPSGNGCIQILSGFLYLSEVTMIMAYDHYIYNLGFILITNGIIDIKDSIFEGSINWAVYLSSMKSINIERSSFKNGIDSMTLLIIHSDNCYLSGLRFVNNTLSNDKGSSIRFVDMTSDMYAVVDDCDFEDNSASFGGAIFLDGCGVKIQNSRFINNTSGAGGAIISLCKNVNETNYLVNNTFSHNNATVGGAIYWENNYLNMSNNSFLDNQAKYGNSVASKPIKLEILKQPYHLLKESEISENDLVCSLDYSISFQVALTDRDNQVASYGYDSFPAFLKCESSDVKMIGDYQKYPKDGIIEFNDLLFTCYPGSEIALSLNYSGKINYFYSSESYSIPEIKISIKTRNCINGEYMNTNQSICEFCTEGKFSLDPSEECKICPRNAYCCGGNQIAPFEGYWHGSNKSSIIYSCPNPNACKGGEKDNNKCASLVGECAEGYRGNLCQPCNHNFSSSGRNKCKKCPDDSGTNAAELIAIFIVSIISIALIAYFSLKTAYEPKSTISIHFRILINYLQMIMFIARLKLNWPWYIDYWLSSQGYPAEVPTHIVSIDCYLMDEDDEDSYKNIYFKKMIMIVILPAALGAAAVIFWLLIAIYKRKWKLMKNELVATLCILLFLILPSITDYMFSIFSCTYIYDNLYLVSNMDIKCWKNDHLYYTLAVALPGIIVWAIGFPACVFLFLYKRKYKLHRLDTKLRFGFLYAGYRKSAYYWEFIVMIRKVIIICLTVFLMSEAIKIQIASCFTVFAIFYYFQNKFYPFEYESLNKTELGSSFVILVTTWCGLFYTGDFLNDIANIIFFLFILFSNFYFVLMWMRTVIIELKLLLIELFPFIESYFDIIEFKIKKKSEIKPIFSLVDEKSGSEVEIVLKKKSRIEKSVDLSILKIKENMNIVEQQDYQQSENSSAEFIIDSKDI